MKKVLFVSLAMISTLAYAWNPVKSAFSIDSESKTLTITVLEEGNVSWSTTEHDFGEITQNEPVEHEFILTNNTEQPLQIKEVKTSCGCTAAGYSEEPLAPGESTEITARYNAKSSGVFTKTIKVFTDVQEEPYKLTIRGEVLAE